MTYEEIEEEYPEEFEMREKDKLAYRYPRFVISGAILVFLLRSVFQGMWCLPFRQNLWITDADSVSSLLSHTLLYNH